MTKQKNDRWIDDWDCGCSVCPDCGESYAWEDYEGVGDFNFCPNCGKRMSSKPLEQTSVLDKIRAEIDKAIDRIPMTFSKENADSCLKMDIAEIIDKYKESEGEE